MRALVRTSRTTSPRAAAEPAALLRRRLAESRAADWRGGTSAPLGRDFSRIPACSTCARPIQRKLAVGDPGDRFEVEADQVAERVLRMEASEVAGASPPRIHRVGAGKGQGLASTFLRRSCESCEEEGTITRQGASGLSSEASGDSEAKVDAILGGQLLSSEQRAYFEPRFGVDFSQVRIHNGSSADAAARAVGALAYTRGRDIVFRSGEYRPDTRAGRHLLAHELTHVVQQGATASQARSPGALGGDHIQRQTSKLPTDPKIYPGQDLKPPGTCSKETYRKVRGGVSAAKAASRLAGGGCSDNPDKGKPGNCGRIFLKIVAGALEILARLVEMVTCFKGGNKSHWETVENKYRMIETCLKAMKDEDCDQKLLDKAAEILTAAAKVILIGAAAFLALALIVIFAPVIMAAIGAAIAALGAAASPLAGAAALILLLLQLLPQGGPPGGPPGTGGDGIPTTLKT